MHQHQLNGSGFCKSYLKIVGAFDESLNQQAVYLHNYMVMYEVFLLFVQASHDKNWELQLSALDKMVRYFLLMTNWTSCIIHHYTLILWLNWKWRTLILGTTWRIIFLSIDLVYIALLHRIWSCFRARKKPWS